MKKFRLTPHILAVALSATMAMTTNAANNLTLQYNRPAEFFEEALVIGNGTLGAIIYGRPDCERISLNDITLWTGEPEQNTELPDPQPIINEIRAAIDAKEYARVDSLQRFLQGHYSQNYQPLGNLQITYHDNRKNTDNNYLRTLNINRALATTINGTRHIKHFASAPDSIIVARITDPNGISATITLDSQLPIELKACGNELIMNGYAAYHSLPNYAEADPEKNFKYDPNRGIHFATIVKAITSNNGKIEAKNNAIEINGCTDVTLLITNATSFNGFNRNPTTEGKPYGQLARARIDNASALSYKQLQNRAETDYRTLFDRISIDLGTTTPTTAALPTDEQLKRYTDLNESNPDLEELYFQYGRYLLISCSRTPGVPANLQGLWNEAILPPWNSNYTTNINLEENYWGSETCALPEMHATLLQFIENLSETGRVSARNHWSVDSGWCLAHNTDIWAMTCPVGKGNDSPEWANWAMGGAWLATHIWENYLFSRDVNTLRRHYPTLRGAAEFAMNWLIEDNGKLLTSPSTSPENRFIAPDGSHWPTMKGTTADLAIIRECLTNARSAAQLLGEDADFVNRIDKTLANLYPYTISPRTGALQEWYYDYDDLDPRHRHQSHLIGLYPGHQITTESTPYLAAACAKTLDIKGTETTGWSAGWRVNLLARLGNADKSYEMLRRLLRYVSPDKYKGPDRRSGGGTYPNLLDAHSPFQIDGNFGGSAGVAEMLVQSSPSTITLLPACPHAWQNGTVNGLRTRTGLTISNLTWANGKVTSVTISAPTSLPSGTKACIRFAGTNRSQSIQLTLSPGQSQTITPGI